MTRATLFPQFHVPNRHHALFLFHPQPTTDCFLHYPRPPQAIFRTAERDVGPGEGPRAVYLYVLDQMQQVHTWGERRGLMSTQMRGGDGRGGCLRRDLARNLVLCTADVLARSTDPPSHLLYPQAPDERPLTNPTPLPFPGFYQCDHPRAHSHSLLQPAQQLAPVKGLLGP